MVLSNKKIITIFSLFFIVSCSGNKEIRENNEKFFYSKSSFDLNKLKGTDELFLIFSKDKNGSPVSLVDIIEYQEVALKKFIDDKKFIEKNDCIRITSTGESTVCDHQKWYDYGLDNKTILTTRKASSDFDNPVKATIMAPIMALEMAQSVSDGILGSLSEGPIQSANNARKGIIKSVTAPEQDFVELEKVKNIILGIANSLYIKEKSLAGTDYKRAVDFKKKYPKDDFSSIIDSNILNAKSNKNYKDIYNILNEFTPTQEQKQKGINVLRSFKSFEGYATAFDLSSDVNDAKKAQELAISLNDQKRTEYMGIKVFRAKNNSISSLFDLSLSGLKNNGIVTKNSTAFFSFSVNTELGVTDFSCPISISAKKKFGLFKYGVYDVSVRLKLTIPVHFYRQSKWLGNEDRNTTREYTQIKVFRLEENDFSASSDVIFDNVKTNYLDRGMMGGITEVVINGSPTIEAEVVDVSLV